MHRQYLLRNLARYAEIWTASPTLLPSPEDRAGEESRLSQIAAFVAAHSNCFERTCLPGHITGSALVVSPDLGSVLLTLHRKLGAWLQLGGHSDGDSLTHQVAMREALEESGLGGLEFLPYEHVLIQKHRQQPSVDPLPFDLDCHVIPARKAEPEHIHYDVRYLIVADRNQPLVISEESQDLRWFTLAEARALTSEMSMVRQFSKLEWLRLRLHSQN